MIELPNKSRVRSLGKDQQGVIYVGGVGEFGYLALEADGKFCYVSLLNEIDPKNRSFTDVWAICPTKKEISFITNEYIFQWNEQTMRAIPFQSEAMGAVV